MKRTLKVAAKVLPWAIVAAVAIFFWRAIAANLDSLRDVRLSVDAWIIGGTVLLSLAVIASGLLWGRIVSILTATSVPARDAVRIHCASWVLKYIPGQVGAYLNKIAWAQRAGLSKRTVSNSFIYDNVLMVIASVLLSVPLVFVVGDALGSNLGLLVPLLVAVPMLIVFSNKLFAWLLNAMLKIVKKPPFAPSDFMPGTKLASLQLGYLLPRLLNGVGFAMIAHSVIGIQVSWIIPFGSAYILASIIGMLAVFVPGGLGVREAVAVALLTPFVPVAQAIVVTLVARLCATVSDLIVALVYVTLNKWRIRQL